MFGSNGQDKADYSRGVLERFTRRAPNDFTPSLKNGLPGGNAHVKTIADPRVIKFFDSAHYPQYFESLHSINENGNIVTWCNVPPTADKIIINHYYTKSREEYFLRNARGNVINIKANYTESGFNSFDRNEEFDDGILKYREAQAKNFRPPDKSHADERLLNALMINLSPTLVTNTPPNFYAGKMETFLTCRAVSSYLKTKLTDETPVKFFEEASLKAILNAVANDISFADMRLLLRELPEILSLPYPVVEELCETCRQVIPQMMNVMRLNSMWKEFVELDYLQRLLKNFKE